jgi:S-adenosylmethionine hydrolase
LLIQSLRTAFRRFSCKHRILDLSHSIAPQDLRHAAFFLEAVIPYFPSLTEVIHVVVVDPGVGSDRAILHVHIGEHQLLVPDNGCWTWLAERLEATHQVIRVEEWKQPRSHTFHGRDIFAPIAARLSLGFEPERLGPKVEDWVRLPKPKPGITLEAIEGEVLFVDRFGNLLSNIAQTQLEPLPRPLEIEVNGRKIKRWIHTYAEGRIDEPAALFSSQGTLEIALPNGNVSRLLDASPGTRIQVRPNLGAPRE